MAAPRRCQEIGARLRNEKVPLKVKDKPPEAPWSIITPTKVRAILRQGPPRDLFCCECSSCESQSGVDARVRQIYYDESLLIGVYATIWALLVDLDYAGLMCAFMRKQLVLDRRIYPAQLEWLDQLVPPLSEANVTDLRRRLLKEQFVYTASPLEILNIEQELDPESALPIEDEEVPRGTGSFGKVWAFRILDDYMGSGFRRLGCERFARKIFHLRRRESWLEEYCNLLLVHGLIGDQNPHIVSTLGAFQYGEYFSIMFPLAQCSLQDYMEVREGSLTSAKLWEQMEGVAGGLAFLHGHVQQNDTRTFVVAYHLDLKPANILFIDGIMQIADFGLSKVKLLNRPLDLDSSGVPNTWGYMPYAPPEHNDREGIEDRSQVSNRGHDIWSLGAIFSEVATFDIRPGGNGQSSLSTYRTNRNLDREIGWGSLCFHLNGRRKESVSSQHTLLHDFVAGSFEPGNAHIDTWKRSFYTSNFFDLLNTMLERLPANRGTSHSTSEALKCRSQEAHQRSLTQELHPPANMPPVLLPRNLFEDARTGVLWNRVGIDLSQNYIEGAANDPVVTRRDIDMDQNGRCQILGVSPLYAKPNHTTSSEVHEDYSVGLRIGARGELVNFRELKDALRFQRLLTQRYVISNRFFPVKRFQFQRGSLYFGQGNLDVESTQFHVQLWSSQNPSAETPNGWGQAASAKIIIIGPRKLYLVQRWNRLEQTEPERDFSENTLGLKCVHGEHLHTAKLLIDDYIPIPLGHDDQIVTKFKSVQIKFANQGDDILFWNDFELLQEGFFEQLGQNSGD
ncbi:MAG: hypothetical protein M1833_003237 [Piccolia ochrophora]|nr:MAG: hypothetical protein M1833_003237 [Piccolia ochrophora]